MSKWLGLPTAASAHAWEVDRIILLVHVMIAVAVVVWGTFYFVPLFKYRASKHPRADYAGLRSKLPYVFVGLLAVIELVLLFGFSLPFWEHQVSAAPAPGEDVARVRVVAQQFQWNFHYPGEDGVFGPTRPELVDDQINPLGIDRRDPRAKDDFSKLGVLTLPVGVKADLHVTSKDVVHSFSVPEFRVKQDAIPGMNVPVRFTPTMTSAEFREIEGDPEREFEVVCAQLCGLGHYQMNATVRIVSREEFDAWVREESAHAKETASDWFDFD